MSRLNESHICAYLVGELTLAVGSVPEPMDQLTNRRRHANSVGL